MCRKAAGFAALALTILGFSDAGQRAWPEPRTLLQVPDVAAFAQDGNRIVWVDPTQPCSRSVQVRNLRTGVTTYLARAGGPSCSGGSFRRRMALAGARALWAVIRGGTSEVAIDFITAAPGSPEKLLLSDYYSRDPLEGDEPSIPDQDPMAGDGRTLVLAAFHAYRVTPTAALVPLTGGTRDVAASRGRFALARDREGGCVCNRDPSWSPDGRKLAFVGARTGENRELSVIDRDGGNIQELAVLRGVPIAMRETAFNWAPDGEGLIYFEQQGISFVDMRGRRRELVSDSRVQASAWSRDRQMLAYSTFPGSGESRHTLHVLAIATSGEKGIATETDSINKLSWSSDGKTLAYEVGENQTLKLIPAGGGDPIPIATSADAYDWAPDGRSLAVQGRQRIDVVPETGGPARPLVQGQVELVGWSPDGRWVAYWRDDRIPGLYVVGSTGTDERIIAGRGGTAAWSPDSSAVAFLRYDEASGSSVVAVADRDSERGLVKGASPRWSPDGRQLAYVVPNEPLSGDAGEIGAVDRDGTHARTLTQTRPQGPSHPLELRTWPSGSLVASSDSGRSVDAVALDGNRLAVLVEGSAGKQIQIRRATGTILRRVSVPGAAANELSMAGRWLVFRTGRTIRVLDTESGARSILTVAQGNVVGLSIEGRRLAWAEQRRGDDRIRAIVLPPR